MTEFKPGDRVKYQNNTEISPEREGRIGTVIDQTRESNVRVRFDEGSTLGCLPGNLVRISEPAGRPLVGPAPKDEGPIFAAPFKYDPLTQTVDDAFHNAALFVTKTPKEFPGLAEELRDDFGRYVAAALNARVFGEE